MKKQKKRTSQGYSVTNALGVSSDERPMDRSMSFWLEKISPVDIAWLWNDLKDSARAALPRISWAQWASGTTYREGFPVDVTACITHDGFVLHFTVKDISRSDGGKP